MTPEEEKRISNIEKRLDMLDQRTAGPFTKNKKIDEMVEQIKAVPPVDRTNQTLVDGGPVTLDHREINPKTGMQKDYVVLSEDERKKGFVRPVRTTYTHKICMMHTTMAQPLAETYARDPQFYTGTFCVGCQTHFPLDQFVWKGTDEQVGS